MMSLGPPAGNGTISLMGFAGKSWAEARVGNHSSVSPASSLLSSLMGLPPTAHLSCALAGIVRDEVFDARSCRLGRSRASSKHEFVGAREPDRSLRDQIAPDP